MGNGTSGNAKVPVPVPVQKFQFQFPVPRFGGGTSDELEGKRESRPLDLPLNPGAGIP